MKLTMIAVFFILMTHFTYANEEGHVEVECTIKNGEINIGQKITFKQKYEWNDRFHPDDGFTELHIPFYANQDSVFVPTHVWSSNTYKVEYENKNKNGHQVMGVTIYFKRGTYQNKKFEAEAILTNTPFGNRAIRLSLSCVKTI